MSNVFEVEWTGKYPSLCYVKWNIKYKGECISLPEDIISSEMNTYGEYSSWHFENWIEVFNNYYDGLNMDEWITNNNYWILKITSVQEEKEELFRKIQENDWRHGSCGGCI